MRNRVKNQILLASVMLAGILFATVNLASGFNIEACKWPGRTPRVDVYWNTNTTGDYNTQAFNAAAAWHNTPTPIYMTLSSSPWITVQAVNYGDVSYDGIANLNCSPVTGAFGPGTTANWNTFKTDSYDSSQKEQVMVHELGHTLGLNHAGTTPCAIPIMYYSSDRYFICGYVVPQQDDIDGINYIYR